MWIDIIQAYADALYVATTLRTPGGEETRRCQDAAPPAHPPAGVLRRLAKRTNLPKIWAIAEQSGTPKPAPASGSTGLGRCQDGLGPARW
jgi:hypothetical protein